MAFHSGFEPREVLCAECGAPFVVAPSAKGGAPAIYCSDECRREARRKRQTERIARARARRHEPTTSPRPVTEKMRQAGELAEAGMKQAEIARRLGVSQPTVCQHIHDYRTRMAEAERARLAAEAEAEEEEREQDERERTYKAWHWRVRAATKDLPITLLKKVGGMDLNIRTMPQTREEWDEAIADLDTAISDIRRVRGKLVRLKARMA
ncbi:hypothetical protein BW14_09775 [Bifidobacterium sp. UTBIF-68]|uniref:helix-turn-helix domain-containing protein n=1 Tax=Bifidobacterium sp. UTBIF-68 TaxID=1465262 RepID=UPI0015E42663|nr:helix-turn-helix domain-containing protein [Bifidobacterium sp. UTBIF-68]TPF92214.1 hypothetical protein BW14_09775 [Bifidobacterium sp. UTBIF-68]